MCKLCVKNYSKDLKKNDHCSKRFKLPTPKSQVSELNDTRILSAIECILYISKIKLNIKEQEIIYKTENYRCRSGKLVGNNFIKKSSFDNLVI